MKLPLIIAFIVLFFEFLHALLSPLPPQPDYEFGDYFVEESNESTLKHFHVR